MFIASNKARPWWLLWLFVGGVFVVTAYTGGSTMGGDVSYGRLASKGFSETPHTFTFLQVAAPIFLLIVTRMRMPVSTTFLLLSCFATTPEGIWDVLDEEPVGLRGRLRDGHRGVGSSLAGDAARRGRRR